MKRYPIVLGFSGLILASGVFADTQEFVAKSTKAGDNCYISGSVTTFTDAEGKSLSGVLFKAVATDDDRLDVHCPKIVLKLTHNASAFVPNMTAEDLQQCQFHEHASISGADGEENIITSGKFVPVEVKANVSSESSGS
ncbi:hypothetical protein Loa_00732 [Legionella oakridgensis ATCC 33761 = DSM 21215]|uniref:Uncharacterized protein n=3 Tax=Legionella oakridgensis TaxID=29423 RepID=W0BCA3_9GAMM|nr:hypothetical protein Loa_00732 [Legionella oakridgensis ATCC 33761 = DSM 21215]ETO93936.1 hypothetical protein LOR_78c22660 [Legionella oakridgensis RV-2-2007]KTD37240.1 hypothetical protein Loak_2376 [Legionella oakridgensis]STY16192.1 Uncharacterised protein [Legionella longbeachae]